jgi:hypothetical protein
METSVANKEKKSGNLLWWIMGAVGVAAIFMLSSFTSSAAAPTTVMLSCSSNPDCLLGYWKWWIKRKMYTIMVDKAAANNVTVDTQIELDAQWFIDQKTQAGEDFKTWESLVSAEAVRVKAITPAMSDSDAQFVAVSNILSRT